MGKNNKKKLLKWVNRLDEKELSSLFKFKTDDLDVPLYLDNVVYNKIDEDIKNETKNVFIKTGRYIRSYALNFAAIFIIIICLIGSIFLTTRIMNNNQNKCFVLSVNGNAFLLDKNNKKSKIRKNKRIKKSSIIETEKSSFVELQIGKRSFITINENTRINANELFKKNNIEKTNLLVDSGEIICKIDKQIKDSLFEVETERLKIIIKGTEFLVNTSGESTEVIVKEGVINAIAKIKISDDIDYIEKIDPTLAQDINNKINKEIIINTNQKLEVSSVELKNGEDKISNIISNIKKVLEKNIQSKYKINEILKKSKNDILNINNIINNLYHIENIAKQKDDVKKETLNEKKETNQISIENLENKKSEDNNELLNGNYAFKIQKLPINPGISLTENKTVITNDGKNIYIASDSNKAIYCVNPGNGKLVWKFDDNKKIKNFNSFALLIRITNDKKKISYKRIIEAETGTQPSNTNIMFIVFTTSDRIFVNETNKKIFKISSKQENLNEDYWLFPVKAENDDVYIPFNNKIYKFNIDSIDLIGNFKYVNDQLFISNDENNLYCLFKNEKVIRIYDFKDLYIEKKKEKESIIKDNKIKWESKKLKDISVISPLLINDYIFTADITGNIYKYKAYSDLEPQIININQGIISSIVFKNDNLYFVANDGYFYRVNINTFSSYDKIAKVDSNPDSIKYNTKRILVDNYNLFFCSDNGNLFWFDIINDKSYIVNIDENKDKLPLVGAPQLINKEIVVFDVNSNIYKLLKK